MPRTAPFEEHAERYDRWFSDHEAVYRSELAALRRNLPASGYGVEVGVGGARFAAPLGIEVGLDPSAAMLAYARERGVEAVRGVAERLPFAASTFDTALIVTTICFVDDVSRTLAEADRVLSPGGSLVIGYIDGDSPVGQRYKEHEAANPFYREASFVSTDELVAALETAGFADFEFVQTVFRPLDEVDGQEPVEEGYGDGSFVVVGATR